MVLAVLILLSSFISVKLSFSVSVIEIVLGIIAGNLGLLQPESWMVYVAGIGGMLLTFLAGTEIDFDIVRRNIKTCLGIGIGSFLISFILVFLFAYYSFRWGLVASLLTATALSETSIAIVYSVILDHGLSGKNMGTILMGSTFVINVCTALTLSVLFMKQDIYTLIFIIASVVILAFAYKFSDVLFESKTFSMQRNEIEIKYVILLIILLMFFATLGGGQALLPVFLLGALLSKPFSEDNKNNMLERLQIVVFSVITPIFFIIGGTKVSIPIILGSFGLFIALFAVRQVAKFIGAYPVVKRALNKNQIYITLILSTGLTFGLVAALYGETNNLITTTEYSIITGVLILSAIIPTIIGDRFYAPSEEDLYDDEKELISENEG
ncbi:cation:proton antiporter [Methanosphaera cuniculi]|uniref:cation:proton antiporter n=1 Tax=Methanosphaera cuniculi TaxID=1077256 RepID=UPI0026EFFF63|nr:cation:proton antiporter [Methanosphaera cuniculi]